MSTALCILAGFLCLYGAACCFRVWVFETRTTSGRWLVNYLTCLAGTVSWWSLL